MRFIPADTPLVILAEGCFGASESKTAIGVIRYGKWPLSAIIDSRLAGQCVQDVLPIANRTPIVASLADALTQTPQPKALLIGTAPIGGGLPDNYRLIIRQAIEVGLHIISGLHVFLSDQPDLVALAIQHEVILWDVRATDNQPHIARQRPRPQTTRVITMVGSDCSMGKMSAGLEIHRALQARGEATQFVATGQTGMMITGEGIPLDRVIGDFMAGTLEVEIDRVIQATHPKWVIVEGQGSLLHPAYSGVTLALLHGSAPDGMILCHNPQYTHIKQYEAVKLPSLQKLITIYEAATAWIKPARIWGIALNTVHFNDEEAQAFITAAQAETGLPVTDPVRYGADVLVDALQ